MKKIFTTLIWLTLALLLTFSLAACAGDGVLTETETETETAEETLPETMPWEDSAIPHYQRPVREIADKAVMETYDLSVIDLLRYEITVTLSNSGHLIRYVLKIGGYTTDEIYTVTLTPDDEIKTIDGKYGKYAKFLEAATDDAIKAAEDRLYEQIKHLTDQKRYYMTIDTEGYLCLTTEVIIEFEEPDEAGMNHTHKFFYERICK